MLVNPCVYKNSKCSGKHWLDQKLHAEYSHASMTERFAGTTFSGFPFALTCATDCLLVAAVKQSPGTGDSAHHQAEVEDAANDIKAGVLEAEEVQVLAAQLHAAGG